jgi:hypothetical protein
VSASAQDLHAVPRRFTRYGDAYAHAAATDGELRVSLPFWAVVLLCLSALFVVGDWLLVYWNISTAGGVATVYLPAWFPIEALFAIVALAAIALALLTSLYDVYEGVNTSE